MNKVHFTMSELENLGYKVIKSYEKDDCITQIRRKGVVKIETTWKKSGEFIRQESYIQKNYAQDENELLNEE